MSGTCRRTRRRARSCGCGRRRCGATSPASASLPIFDVGASAGLNLVADQSPAIWRAADGSPLRVAPLPRVIERTGFDLRPLDPSDDDDARWLRACVWPGQGEREMRLEQAIAAFRAALDRPGAPRVRTAAAARVPGLLPAADDRLALVYQSVMRDYLEPAERAAYEAGMQAWLASRPPGTSLWVELEVLERGGAAPAGITAHVATGDGVASKLLARCEPHPLRLDVAEDAVEWLRNRLAADTAARPDRPAD